MDITEAATESTSSVEAGGSAREQNVEAGGSAREQHSKSTDESPDSTPMQAGQPEFSSQAEAPTSAELEQVDPRAERRRLEEQLNALKRREAELRRALAIADHPELADAVRALDGATYAVTRIEAKMAQGLSKSEEKRRETVEKKLAQAEEKRAELDSQIAEFRAELNTLGEERVRTFESER